MKFSLFVLESRLHSVSLDNWPGVIFVAGVNGVGLLYCHVVVDGPHGPSADMLST